jgi:hypothetical protein
VPVLNPLRHPQLLFLGFSEGDPRLDAMRRLAGHSVVLTASHELDQLRLADFAAIVIEGTPVPHQVSDMHVLAFASPNLGQVEGLWASVLPDGEQPSRTLELADDLSPELRRLLTAETLPWVEQQAMIPFLQRRAIGTVHPSSPRNFDLVEMVSWISCVRDADRNVVVGAFPRFNARKWCWSIPHVSANPELWLQAVTPTWRERDPELFPAVDPWRERQPWLTESEVARLTELERLRSDHQRAEEQFRVKEIQLTSQLTAVSREADAGVRRLLTSQGEELVGAVQDALVALGFEVEDFDAVRAGQSLPKVEDLHVVSPDDPDVVVIAEVKGYARGGAKTSDLMQAGQHMLRYAQREERAPDRCWYIVNQFASTDPDTRPAPLAGAAEDLRIFAEGGGVVIDTRELFKVVQMVCAEALTADVARATLMRQTGVFTLDGLEPDVSSHS